MSVPALSVIMPMYNSAAYVAAAVESVLAQTEADFEFLIVDDGSTDNSADIVEGYVKSDPRITLFRRPNSGVVASLNFLLDQARAPLVARMDSDDICLPGRFAAQRTFMDAHPDIGAVGTQFVEIDGSGAVTDRSFRHPERPADIRAALDRGTAICHPSVMLRSAAVRQIGGYRAAFRYCEDYDLFLRLSRVTDLANLGSVELHYRRTGGQISVKHNGEQTRQSVYALFAHREVQAGGADPFAEATVLPPLDNIDTRFGRPGVEQAMRAEMAQRLKYSREALAGADLQILCAHAASGAAFPGGWRTVGRALRLGLPLPALRLSSALLQGRMRSA